MARTKRAARLASEVRAPRIAAPYKQFGDPTRDSSGRTYEPVDDQLVTVSKLTPRLHPRDFVQLTHTEADERF